MFVIKIVFTILLLVPIFFFMRFLLRKLSSETSGQSYTREEIRSYNSRGEKRKSQEKSVTVKKKSTAGSGTRTEKTRPTAGSGTAKPKVSEQKKQQNRGYTPRQPAEWHRSERIPFGEPKQQWKKPSDSLKEMDEIRREHFDEVSSQEALPLKKKKSKHRSDKTPTKRQLRKNRERARKRDLKKRKAERKQEGKNN